MAEITYSMYSGLKSLHKCSPRYTIWKKVNDKQIPPIQDILQWPNMPKRKFNRNTERCHLLQHVKHGKFHCKRRTRKEDDSLQTGKEGREEKEKKKELKKQQVTLVFKSWMTVPLAARSKAKVYSCSPAEIVGSNPTRSMNVCLLWVLCVVR